jgi:hypothetical protein
MADYVAEDVVKDEQSMSTSVPVDDNAHSSQITSADDGADGSYGSASMVKQQPVSHVTISH